MDTTTEPECVVCVAWTPRLLAPRRSWPLMEIEGFPVHPACGHDLQFALMAIREQVRKTDGDLVWRWVTTDRCPPSDFMQLAKTLGYATQTEVECTGRTRKAEDDEFVAEYRRQDRPASAEELDEMRAAFGPGAVVVDVLSGRRVRT